MPMPLFHGERSFFHQGAEIVGLMKCALPKGMHPDIQVINMNPRDVVLEKEAQRYTRATCIWLDVLIPIGCFRASAA